ncbi:MAG: glutamate decarboxylase [Candidatus Infernicultor aquiphilus]|uniref:Glutamate decarboxylase n=1 Tax=Candidatus Infernicultor aquiphilus TaxID=1805029 RepID=A0A2M7K627_9BACT|nr:MAG: glutamate decarboxylase [Candidatus Atribacteria bacterium CG08_land_8_20_14_0_20_33_29]PIX33591.1 MAG: glutamate decarboxylase [Candidatus Atribacteria bacterium CG_4_8_14_3_um_filter_34_18]
MWKVIYIAKDISLATNLEKILKNKGIITILNQLEMSEDELNGNVEILVSNWEAQEAMDIINQTIIYDNNLLNDIG